MVVTDFDPNRLEARLARLEALNDRLPDLLDKAVALLEALPGGVAAATDVVDDLAAAAMDGGVGLDVVGRRLSAAASTALVAVGSEELTQGPDRVGVFGLIKALRDPDVQRALAMVVRLAKAVGAASRTDDEGDTDHD